MIPFSSKGLNLIPPVTLPMSFITKVEIHFLVWDPIQNHTWLPVSMSFFIRNSSSTLYSGTVSVLRITNHLFCRMTSVQVVWCLLAIRLRLCDFGGHSTAGSVWPFQSFINIWRYSASHCTIFLTASFPSSLMGMIFCSSFGHAPGSFLSFFWLSPFHPRHFFTPSLFYFLRMNSGKWGKSWRKKWRR